MTLKSLSGNTSLQRLCLYSYLSSSVYLKPILLDQHVFQKKNMLQTPIIDRDAIPGTFTLIDENHVLTTRHLDSGDRDIVLVPEPSDDPDDPLNWSPRRKLLSTVCVSA
jgi:hypothetical protein